MYRHFDLRFDKVAIIIQPGEFFATSDDIVIGTVLGSCVSVALYDPVTSIGGLNHFMLPDVSHDISLNTPDGKYGAAAMELLLNALLKLGSRKKDLMAKVFGGGVVLSTPEYSPLRVSENNIHFAFKYLKIEKIPVVAADVGGKLGRKLFFFPKTARVLIKKLNGSVVNPITEEEKRYLEKVRRELENFGGNPPFIK
ncbi:MAG: hypothetical protein AB1798_12985 [Spirochaetota bacterium]